MKKNSEEILPSLDLYEIFSSVNHVIVKSLNPDISQIILVNGEDSIIVSGNEIKKQEIHLTPAIYLESLNTQTTIIRNDTVLQESEIAKLYCSTPIFSRKGDILAALTLIYHQKDEFTPAEISLLENMAQMTALVLEKHLETQKIKKVFTDFLHKTVHDLKNPFTSIALTAELLKRKADDPKTVNNLAERIEKANDKVFSNLERLKSAFPIHNSSFKLDVREISLTQLFEEIKQDFKQYEIITEDRTEAVIYGDPHRLKDALRYLLTHLSLLSNSSNIYFRLTQKDNDIQICIANHDTESFDFTEDELESNPLSIAKTLIEMHKGKISTAHHKETGNYCFYISLPLTTP